MRNILFFLLIIFFQFSYVQAQKKSNFLKIHEISIKDKLLVNDTSLFHLLETPFLGFDVSMHSSPGLRQFLTIQGNNLLINFHDYNNNFDDSSHHLLDVHNQLLRYSFRHTKNIYSFGVSHRLVSEFSLSSELVSLIIDGNAQYLNQKLIMDDQNHGYILNYISFDFGYYNQINNDFSLGAKFKLIKGLNSMGVELKNSSFLVSDNLNTSQNPFEIELDAEASYFINSNNNLFSNLGFAIDVYLDYDYTDKISFYTQAYDVGFVIWNENQYDSDGILNFNGLNFSLDQFLNTEYNMLQDSILDIFELTNQSVNKLRVLPFMINLGTSYSLYDNSQVNLNYSIKKNAHSFIHTTKLSYMCHLEKYNFSIIPSYSINKYDYTNIGILLNKRWKSHFYTNVYFNNIIDLLFANSGGEYMSLGCELYFVF